MLVILSVTGCSISVKPPETNEENDIINPLTAQTSYLSADEMFTKGDKDADYDDGFEITLSDDGISSSCSTLIIAGRTVTVKEEGTYIMSGTLSDGQIIVDAEKTDKVRLVLNSVNIKNSSSAPIYVRQADKVFITLPENSINVLSAQGGYNAIDGNNIDAAVFSKDDLTINGKGSLEISAYYGHGIVSKDELAICGGNITVTSEKHALAGKDNVKISDGNLSLNSGKDGIHAENTDDTASGFVYICAGNLNIVSDGDGIDAAGSLQIDGGNITVKSGGGASEAVQKTPDFFVKGFSSAQTSPSDTDAASTKGIKSSGSIIINGGIYNIDSADDCIHTNVNAEINGGDFILNTGDDAIHADYNVLINSGNIAVNNSYEGIEGMTVDIRGGNIELHASDDGLNSAGGNDQSGFGGGKIQQVSSASGAYIRITGGILRVFADGDGIDSNGSIYVSGGEIYVEGPENSGNGALDYDKIAEISGGSVIAAGASGMAQGFTDGSTQGAMLLTVSNSMVNGEITLSDSDGKVLLSYTPQKSYNSVLISCADIKKGSSYTVSAGGNTKVIEMTDIIYGSGSDMPGGKDAGGMMPGGHAPGGDRGNAQTPPNGFNGRNSN